MNHFKSLTVGKVVIMGKNTLKSIGGPLKNRINIVLSKEGKCFSYNKENAPVVVVSSLKEALKILKTLGVSEVFVIGGESIYNQFLDRGIVDRIYITVINHKFKGDTYFSFDKNQYTEIERRSIPGDDKTLYGMDFITYQLKNK